MAKVPFGKPYPSVDSVELREGMAAGLIDGYIDEVPGEPGVFCYVKRPGLTLYVTQGSARSDGLYVSPGFGHLTWWKTGTNIFRVNNANPGTVTACTGDTVSGDDPVRWAEDGSFVYAADGSRVHSLNTTSLVILTLDKAGDPTGVSHVIWCQGFLMCNGLVSGGVKGDVNFSDDGGLTWEQYNNEKLPDGCHALMTDGLEVAAFGHRSIEFSVLDGVTPWAAYDPGFVPYGTLAPWTVVRIEGTYYWLGTYEGSLKVMRLEGRTVKPISSPYDDLINNLTGLATGPPSTPEAFCVTIDEKPFYVITFPVDNLTLAYNIQHDDWSQVSYLNAGTREDWLMSAYCYSEFFNRHYVGDRRANGRLYTLGGLTDNGDPIKFELTSGHISRGSDARKTCPRMLFKVKRGQATDSSEPEFSYSTRDDGRTNFATVRAVGLGLTGDSEFYGHLNRCGMYRQRQHKIIHEDTVSDFIFVHADESYNVES